MSITRPKAVCRHCGGRFEKLKHGKIPTHDFPRACRSVCPGSGEEPKQDPETPLWKDDPDQRGKDFFTAARFELRLVGFAMVKELARMSDRSSGTMQCPLCLKQVRFSIASTNGHCAAKCETEGCIEAME